MNRRCMRGLYERGDAAGVDARRGGGHDGRASFVCTSTRLDLLTAPQPYHETTHAAPDAHHPITANRTIQPAKRAPRTIPPHRLTNPMARHAPARAHARLADGCSHLPLCCPSAAPCFSSLSSPHAPHTISAARCLRRQYACQKHNNKTNKHKKSHRVFIIIRSGLPINQWSGEMLNSSGSSSAHSASILSSPHPRSTTDTLPLRECSTCAAMCEFATQPTNRDRSASLKDTSELVSRV